MLRVRRPIARGALACAAVVLIAGCASADKTSTTTAAASSAAASASGGSMAGMNMGPAEEKAISVDGIKPVPTQTLATADWQGMKIVARATTAVPFVIFNGTSERMIKPGPKSSFHLMVMLNDAHTGVPLPYASVWATIRKAGKVVYDERQWPMISEYMGPHYGNDVSLPGGGNYQLSLLVSPPISARHVEYQHVWLTPAPSDLHLPLEARLMTGSADGGGGRGWTRRRFFLGAATVAAGGAAAGVALDRAETSHGSAPEIPKVALGSQPAGLPARQFAWTATLKTDRDGNPIAPRHDRLLFFDVQATPSPAAARLLEASLRTLERAFAWGPGGLLFTAGWAPGYFERSLRIQSPIPRAKRLSEFELPAIDDYDLCLHLACDDERRLADVEAGLVHGAPLPGCRRPSERWLRRCAGERRAQVSSARACRPPTRTSAGFRPALRSRKQTPLFMGFKSGLATQPGNRGVGHDPDRRVRAGNDDAGQLHAPAAGQLV